METIIYLQSSRNVADPVSGLAHSADTVGDGSPAQSVANPPLSGVVASGSSAGGMSPVPSTSSTTSEAAANIRASVDGSQSSSGILSRPAGIVNAPDDTRTHPGNDFTFVSTSISAPS